MLVKHICHIQLAFYFVHIVYTLLEFTHMSTKSIMTYCNNNNLTTLQKKNTWVT